MCICICICLCILHIRCTHIIGYYQRIDQPVALVRELFCSCVCEHACSFFFLCVINPEDVVRRTCAHRHTQKHVMQKLKPGPHQRGSSAKNHMQSIGTIHMDTYTRTLIKLCTHIQRNIRNVCVCVCLCVCACVCV